MPPSAPAATLSAATKQRKPRPPPLSTNGFKQDDDKQKFLQQIDELRATLRELQTKTAEAPGLSQDAKDEIAAEVMQQVNVLKKAKDEAAGLPVAQEPAPATLQ